MMRRWEEMEGERQGERGIGGRKGEYRKKREKERQKE